MPSFSQRKEDEDLFSNLGPLATFNGDSSWSAPRTVLLMREKGSFGIFVRGSQPVVVTGVDQKGSAEVSECECACIGGGGV